MPYKDPEKRKAYHKKYIVSYMKEYRKTDKFKIWDSSFRRTEDFKKSKKSYDKEYREEEKTKLLIRTASWKRNGIFCSIDLYNTMFEEQKGCCNICGKHQKEFKHSLAVDHCHTTGRIRGLLCPSCNTKLAFHEKYIDKITTHLSLINLKEI